MDDIYGTTKRPIDIQGQLAPLSLMISCKKLIV